MENVQKEFCKRWYKKAGLNSISEDIVPTGNVEHYIDKFISLFICFNALYDECTIELIKSGKIGNRDHPDEKSATTHIDLFLGSKNFLKELEEFETELNLLITFVKHQYFYFTYGSFDVAVDPTKRKNDYNENKQKKLSDHLEDKKDLQKKSIAILTLMYKIRCNVFHGRKSVDDDQKNLLLPAIRILDKTVKITYKKLTGEEIFNDILSQVAL